MSDTQGMMPELTLNADAAKVETPSLTLTLEPEAPAAPTLEPEKPKPAPNTARISSPSRKITVSPAARSSSRQRRPMVVLPAPDRPVSQ